MPQPTTCPIDELKRLHAAGGALPLIDVRTPAEYMGVHVNGAVNTPLDTLDPDAVQASRPVDAAGPVLVLCRGGQRAAQAAAKLNAAGVEAVAVQGGMLACIDAGVPVVRGRKTVSIERQVRIGAGSLVALGTALGWFAHPGFFAVPAFVGCGLVFAGVSDTCAMGHALMRMPWNRPAGG